MARQKRLPAFLLIWVLAACAQTEQQPSFLVTLVADGRELTYEYNVPVTVAEFLRDAEVEIGELDRVEPPQFTQIRDGMRVTVVRVEEQTECEEQEIPYQTRRVLNEGLDPGEELLGQAGLNGVEEICYRLLIEDGARRDPVEISRVVLTESQDEVIYVGPTGELDPVPVVGTLAYINNRNAWAMSGNSSTKRPLTTSSDLDRRVFSLSSNGRQLMFTRDTRNSDRENFLNQLWMLSDTTRDLEPIQLVPEDVLWASWIPGRENFISYSTGEARQTAPGWQAFNDLWTMRLDPQTGETLGVTEVLEPSSGGLYGWWGTNFAWSNNGDSLAWVRADSVGTVDLETGDLQPLLQYPLFNTSSDWSWRSTLSWSPDDDLLLTTTHGAPIGNEPAELSPVFHVTVTDKAGSFQAQVFKNTGIWAAPRYSPLFTVPGNEFPSGRMAYLQARDVANSINAQAEYDLMVADRDGSNRRLVFPPNGQAGLNAQNLAWSPDGRQIACIYQGNLWIVDVETMVAHQLTLDGGASNPVWTL
ncbi:MAG: G5 domain-containing protein [Anaerolineae bacterium]|nr:G5 domain-containing protein [Anaerolineae bacterium]